MTPEKQYTAREVAEILRLNKQTVLRYCREGKLKASKIGKAYIVSESELNRMIKEGK